MNIYNLFQTTYSKLNDIICEGGASGHMSHLFEDPDLKFSDLKKIFTNLFKGRLSIEEKTDGQNLVVTYKNGMVGAARNKKTLENPIDIDDVDKTFDGKGEVKEAFVKSMKDITSAIKTLSEEELIDIFANGKKYMAFEIIYPPTKNVVDYGGRCLIQLHGVNKYDKNWNKIGEDKPAADKLYELLKSHNALKQETFEITNHTKLQLKDSKTGEESLKLVMDELEKIVDGLGWNATINDYAQERFEKYIVNRANEANFPLSKNSDFVKELAVRLSKISKRKPNKYDIATFAKRDGLDIKSKEYKDFVKQIDSTQDDANMVVIKPLEDLVIKAGLLLMKNLVGYISTDPNKTARKLAVDLDKEIQNLTSKETSLDISKLKRFKNSLAKLDQYQREMMPAEGVVFIYKGKVYKLTATFGAANQLMGILKYKN